LIIEAAEHVTVAPVAFTWIPVSAAAAQTPPAEIGCIVGSVHGTACPALPERFSYTHPFKKLGPGGPVSPVSPVGPAGPSTPAGPAGPWCPGDPVQTVAVGVGQAEAGLWTLATDGFGFDFGDTLGTGAGAIGPFGAGFFTDFGIAGDALVLDAPATEAELTSGGHVVTACCK